MLPPLGHEFLDEPSPGRDDKAPMSALNEGAADFERTSFDPAAFQVRENLHDSNWAVGHVRIGLRLAGNERFEPIRLCTK